MKKAIALVCSFILVFGFTQAQTDTMYFMKSGKVILKQSVKPADVDSIIFYQPHIALQPLIAFTTVEIPAGTFTMGCPVSEEGYVSEEAEHEVTLSAFKISKYETTNAQFAEFLNAKGIGSDGLYPAGNYPDQPLIYPSHYDYDHNWGLNYIQGKWVPVQGLENHPVIYVSWYGATEFAAYLGGRLPTEAEWEYACRANTTTPFFFGTCLTNYQANYDWPYPYSMCMNMNDTAPRKTQKVGSYPPNGFGLYDMHGNVWEWCSDWYGPYPQIAETDPQGPAMGPFRVCRGGGWSNIANSCRSAMRYNRPMEQTRTLGFRVVIQQYHTL